MELEHKLRKIDSKLIQATPKIVLNYHGQCQHYCQHNIIDNTA